MANRICPNCDKQVSREKAIFVSGRAACPNCKRPLVSKRLLQHMRDIRASMLRDMRAITRAHNADK